MALFTTKPTFRAYFDRAFDQAAADPEYNLSALAHPKAGITSKSYIDLAVHLTRLDDLRAGEVHCAIVSKVMNRQDRWLIVPTIYGAVAVPEDGDSVWWDEVLAKRVSDYFPDDRAELELLVKQAIVLGANLSNLIQYVAECDEQRREVWTANRDAIAGITSILTGEHLISELR
jgi:hypothetical protein